MPSFRAEGQDRFAGGGVDGLEVVVDLEEEAAVLAVRTLPVVDAAAGDAAQPGVNPQLLARGRVEGDERLVLRQHVHRGAGDDRVELVDVVVADGIRPRHRQAGDVGRRDLGEVDELRRVGTAAVVFPLARRLGGVAGGARRAALLRPAGGLRQQRADDRDADARDDGEMTGVRPLRAWR
jgi:hypothetical protein